MDMVRIKYRSAWYGGRNAIDPTLFYWEHVAKGKKGKPKEFDSEGLAREWAEKAFPKRDCVAVAIYRVMNDGEPERVWLREKPGEWGGRPRR